MLFWAKIQVMSAREIKIESTSKLLFKILKWLFNSDSEVMSDEVKEIISNPDDKAKYLEAIEELRTNGDKPEVTIELSNHESLTLVR